MTSNELRIGNYLEFRHPTMGWSCPNKCESWMIRDIELIPNSYRAIPLTEEWLVKFGFEKHRDSQVKSFSIRLNSIVISYSLDEIVMNRVSIKTNFDSNDWIHIDNIKYVHELQNLHFVLTQTELEIK